MPIEIMFLTIKRLHILTNNFAYIPYIFLLFTFYLNAEIHVINKTVVFNNL